MELCGGRAHFVNSVSEALAMTEAEDGESAKGYLDAWASLERFDRRNVESRSVYWL